MGARHLPDGLPFLVVPGAVAVEVAAGRVVAAVAREPAPPGGPAPAGVLVTIHGQAAGSAVMHMALSGLDLQADDVAREEVRARHEAAFRHLISATLAAMALEVECTCGAPERKCPHMAAAALTFAAEVAEAPERLLAFLFTDDPAAARRRPHTPVRNGRYWAGTAGAATPHRTGAREEPAARVDLPLRVGTPPAYRGRVSDVDVAAVMRAVCAALADLADDGDLEADIASVPFGLPAAEVAAGGAGRAKG